MNVKESDFPSPSILNKAFQHHFKVPVVFKNRLKSWTLFPSTIEQLSDKYGRISLSFRLVPRDYQGISWEGTAKYVEATINEFNDWLNGPVDIKNPFYSFHQQEIWAYSGYNHMIQTFGEYEDIVQAVDWSSLGCFEMPGRNSAFWIGTKGAYTPCHYDTYGSNLVAQVQGSKRWTLFPPEDISFLYPTRIPYEESSVFSSVNIIKPDLKVHPLFKFSHPYVITLHPGDVLFVPHNWWHFVECLDTSISANTWIKMQSNPENHLEEAVVRALMTSLISYFEPEGDSWLNANEELVSPEETLKYISAALQKIESAKCVQKEVDRKSDLIKSAKTCLKSDVHSDDSANSNPKIEHKDIQYVTPTSFLEWYGQTVEASSSNSQPATRKNIVDCFAHPEVISVICKLLKNM